MADVDKLTRTFKPSFRRDRELELNAAQTPRPKKKKDTTPRVVEMLTNFASVEAKGQRILDEALQIAVVRNVPVDADATEVRGAVLRQDPDSQGLFITFDLYRKSYEYLQRASRSLPLEVLDEMSGDFTTDADRVTRKIRELTDGIDSDEAALLGDQLVILFILKLLLLGYDSVSTGAQTATKQPSTLELPVIAIQLATSFAAQQLYAGLNEDAAKAAVQELQGQIPEANVQEGRDFLQNSDLFQAALKQRTPSDYQLIVSYVQAFLKRQKAPGWEAWQLAPDLQESVTFARETRSLLDRYQRDEDATSTERPKDVLSFISRTAGAAPGLSLGESAAPSDTVLDLYQRGLNALNQQIDQLAYILGGSFNIQELCCYIKFLNGLGTEPVQVLRSNLDVAQNVITKLNEIPQFQINKSLAISTLIHQNAMLLLQDLQETINKKILNWIRAETDKWNELFQQCGLIDELIEFITMALEQLEIALVSLLDRYLGFLEDRDIKIEANLQETGGLQRLRFHMLAIDQWLEFGGAEGGICPETPAEATQIAAAAERVLSNLGPSIELPPIDEDSVNRFSVLSSPPLVLNNGMRIPSVAGGSAGVDLQQAAVEACRLGTVSQNIVPFPNG